MIFEGGVSASAGAVARLVPWTGSCETRVVIMVMMSTSGHRAVNSGERARDGAL